MDLAKSSLKLFIARLLKSLISFTAVIVFSRNLGADPLGVYYPFIALLGVALLPSDLGVGSAVTKRLSEGEERRQYVGAGLVMKALLLAIVGFGSLLAMDQINQFLGADLIIPFILALLFDGLGRISLNILRGELRVGETAFLEILRPLGWLVIGYILYVQGYGATGLVYGYLFGSALVSLVGWWKVSVFPAYPRLTHIYSLFNYGKYSAISSVGGFFYSWMDVLILTAFVTIGASVTRGDIGAYENAWRLSLIVMILSKSIATVMFPQISEWEKENAINKIESSIPTVLFPSLLIVIPGFVGTLILSRDLLQVLFGPEFTVAWVALIILAAGKIPQSIHVLFSKILNGIDRPDLAAIAATLSAVLNVIFNIIFIWKYGLVGAAMATTASFVVNTILHAYYLNKFLDIRLPVRKIGWVVIASGVMGICVYSITRVVEPIGAVSLVGIVLVGVATYFLSLSISKEIRTDIQGSLYLILPDELVRILP